MPHSSKTGSLRDSSPRPRKPSLPSKLRRSSEPPIGVGYDTVDAPIPPDDTALPDANVDSLPNDESEQSNRRKVTRTSSRPSRRPKSEGSNSKPSSNTMPIKLPSQTDSKDQPISPKSQRYPKPLPEGQARCNVCQKRFKTTNRRYSDLSEYICRGCDGSASKTSRRLFEDSNNAVDFGSTEKCAIHKDRQIKSFCDNHCHLCCELCEISTHRECQKSTLDAFLIKSDAKQLKHSTTVFVHEKLALLIRKRKNLDSKLEEIQKVETDVKDQIQVATSELIDNLRNMEEELLKQVDSHFERKKLEIDSDMENCKTYIDKLTKAIRSLEEPKIETKSQLRKLETIKQLEKEVGEDGTDIELILDKQSDIEHCKFEVNEKLTKAISEAESLGSIVLSVQASPANTQDLDDNFMSSCTDDDVFHPVDIEKYDRLTTWCTGDVQNETNISCIKLLHNNDIMICDIESKKIKWFSYNGRDFTIKGFKKFDTRPWYIDRLSGNRYIITLPDIHSFVIMEIGDGSLRFSEPVDLGYSYYSVCCVAEDTIVFAKTSKTHFLSTRLNGSKATPTFDKEFEKMFSRPNHLLYSKDSRSLFVNDPDTGVYIINFETKELIRRYKPHDLICPLEMVFGGNGDLTILDSQSNVVHCLSRWDGEFRYHATLKTLPDSLSAQCICYIPHTDEYIISFVRQHKLLKFRLAED